MDKFYFLTHDIHDPYFNLASEEYLLKHTDRFYIYLWINEPAVIVGVNQNASAEVNFSFVKENQIKVVRRLTGGGAVYHDLNNICYTVIAPYKEGENYYRKFTAPVIEYLSSLKIKAEFTGRNDLVVDGKKISGNAQTVYKDRIMHHGTLLFDTDTSVLSSALNPSKLKVESKGIKSVKSRVVNIRSLLKNDMGMDEFKNGLIEHFLKNCERTEFSAEDKAKIESLVNTKYSDFNWNIGYSPKASNVFEHKCEFGILKLVFDLIDGKIANAFVSGDFFSKKPIEEFTEKLNGTTYNYESLIKAFSRVEDYIVGATAEAIVKELF